MNQFIEIESVLVNPDQIESAERIGTDQLQVTLVGGRKIMVKNQARAKWLVSFLFNGGLLPLEEQLTGAGK